MEVSYSEIRNELNTGDIILYSGSSVASKLIQWASGSRWSHIGLVIKLEEYDLLTVWEATPASNVKDIFSNTIRKGVQLLPLSERIHAYDGSISIRKLQGNTLSVDSLKNLMLLRKELKNKKYEQSKTELLKSLYDGPWGKNEKEDLSSVFCGELVAEAYQRLLLLDEKKVSNEYIPADFGEGRLTRLNNGFYLSEEIEIVKE